MTAAEWRAVSTSCCKMPGSSSPRSPKLTCPGSWPRSRYVCLWLLMLAFAASVSANEISGVSYSARLYTPRSAAEGTYPIERIPSFGCDEEIHIRIHWRKLPVGKHIVTILWIDPQGRVAQQSDGNIAVNEYRGAVSDYWLVISRSLGGRLRHMVGTFSRREWRVVVALNGVSRITRPFWVDC